MGGWVLGGWVIDPIDCTRLGSVLFQPMPFVLTKRPQRLANGTDLARHDAVESRLLRVVADGGPPEEGHLLF